MTRYLTSPWGTYYTSLLHHCYQVGGAAHKILLLCIIVCLVFRKPHQLIGKCVIPYMVCPPPLAVVACTQTNMLFMIPSPLLSSPPPIPCTPLPSPPHLLPIRALPSFPSLPSPLPLAIASTTKFTQSLRALHEKVVSYTSIQYGMS